MKKYIFILWTALTAMSAFTACTNEHEITEGDESTGKTVTIRAVIADSPQSRIAMGDEDEKKLSWSTGDQFKLKIGEDEFTFTHENGNNFTCSDDKLPATIAAGTAVTATYPATTPASYATQTGTKAALGNNLQLSTPEKNLADETPLENLTLEFVHQSAVVKLTLNHEDFTGQNVTGITIKSGSTTVVTATETFTGSTDGRITLYFAIPAAALDMKNVTILSVREENYYATTLSDKTLEAGKLYNVEKAMTKMMGNKTAEQAVKGDFAMSDGTFISKDATLTNAQKAEVRGIVFWTTAETNTTGRTTPASLADDKIMKTDFPDCTHGLIVSLKNVSTATKWQTSQYYRINNWQNNTFTAENKSDYQSILSGTGPTDPINYILGYQNTKLLKAFNAQCDNIYKVLPVSLLTDFSANNPAPANTTGWFIPSVKELHMLCYKDVDNVAEMYNSSFVDTRNTINTSLNAVGGELFGTGSDVFYWSSTETSFAEQWAFALRFAFANVASAGKSTNESTYYVRAVCAF